MWTRTLLKENARASLKINYWRTFLACLIASAITGELLLTFQNRFSSSNSNGELNAFFESSPGVLDTYTTTPTMPNLQGSFSTYPDDFWSIFFTVLIVIFLIAFVLSTIYSTFIANPIYVGLYRYMMESRIGNAPIATMFSTFKSHYLKTIGSMFWMNLKLFLWTLCFIIPGIIKTYAYFAVPYILAENPTIPKQRAIELSTLMTDGEKLDIFVLHLSFFGWHLLSIVTFGLSELFLAPYIQATNAELYAALRAKAFAFGYTTEAELSDFVRHE